MVLSLLAGWFFCQSATAGDGSIRVNTDGHGRIHSFELADEQLAVSTNLRVPLKGWARLVSLDNSRDVKLARQGDRGERQTWRGRMEVSPGGLCRYEQTLGIAGDRVELTWRVVSEAALDVEGVFLWVLLPIEVFSGGEAELTAAGEGQARRGALPTTLPEQHRFLGGAGTGINIAGPQSWAAIRIGLDRACSITLQDERKWQGNSYGLLVQLHRGPLAAGQEILAKATIQVTIVPDTTAARLTVDCSRRLYSLDGFGGNYCFSTESPVTQYTLDNLRVAWARTEMHLKDWEPANDNESPDEMNWAAFEARDRSGSQVRQDLEMARRISQRRIPFVISVWHVPDWLCAGPGRADGHGRVIPRAKWSELAESVAAYLLYAKRKYGIEPDLFSFNETDIGVMVLLTADEHRDLIRLLGACFARLGLKTKLLLGDTANARAVRFTGPAADDPEALKHIGAVGFHSWGGADPAAYRRWAELADRLKLPLLVTELGVDANWRARPHEQPGYWLREARMYQELLLHARPAGTMQWEFTGDYPTVAHAKNARTGEDIMVPTERFTVLRHFCNLTPPGAVAVHTESDHPKVLLTAFWSDRWRLERVHTFHVVNTAAGRKATIRGLPAGLGKLRAVRTASGELFRELDPADVRNGEIELDLAARSLLTLTNMPR